MNDIFNIFVDPNNDTVVYNLVGNRLDDPTKSLTKIFSVHDSEELQKAVKLLVGYFEHQVK